MKILGSGESKLETIISYLLIIGVAISFVIITAGVISFYITFGHLNILVNDPQMFIHGQNFFSFLFNLLAGQYSMNIAITLIALGVSTLLLTVYVRVIASVIYFIWRREFKYVFMTVFVLAVLTISLALH